VPRDPPGLEPKGPRSGTKVGKIILRDTIRYGGGSIALAKRMTLGGNSTTEEEAAVLRDTFLNTNPELIYFKKNYTQYTSMKPYYYIEISI